MEEIKKFKAEKVFVRYGIQDVVMPIEKEDEDIDPINVQYFLIGYEDEEGNECDKEGNYL